MVPISFLLSFHPFIQIDVPINKATRKLIFIGNGREIFIVRRIFKICRKVVENIEKTLNVLLKVDVRETSQIQSLFVNCCQSDCGEL